MSKIVAYMDKKFYSSYLDNWDDYHFRKILLEKMKSEYSCLDYGAGRGNVEEMNFKGIVKFVAGIDPEEEIYKNPYLDEAKQLDIISNKIPYEDNTFDMVFSDNVMEHIQNPDLVLSEVFRVLKPGGCFLYKTPNKWHYMPIIARLTPTWFHRFYNKLRGRDEIDTFPTVYKLNSTGDLKIHASISGLSVKRIQLLEGRPEYLRLTAITYFFGFLYERIVNSTDILSFLRCVMISELEKPK